MPLPSKAKAVGAGRRDDSLLRAVMMPVFASGALAILVLWMFEANFALLDEICRITYPLMLASFIGCAAMLYRWPKTIGAARWAGFCTISCLFFLEFAVAMTVKAPLVGNYAFVSLLMWLPLGYAIALFMLDARQGPWAALGLFAFIALVSVARLVSSDVGGADDKALLVNLLASHAVLLVCMSGLFKVRLALFRIEVRSRRLFKQASSDSLTGLANRRRGVEMLRRASARHVSDAPSAVILCDIDHFKGINDRYGHDVGDRVVLAVAALLLACTRSGDTVVRWGGDEFLMVIPGIGRHALMELAERLRRGVAEESLLDEGGARVPLSLSLGVAEMSGGEAPEEWIKRADRALYRAKENGRNCCVFSSPEALRPDAPE